MKIDYLKTSTAKISHPTPHLIPDCWAALITADSRSHVDIKHYDVVWSPVSEGGEVMIWTRI